MKTTNSLLIMITQNCYMAKLDIKDAYYSITLLEKHQKYLKLFFWGNFINSPTSLTACFLDQEGLQNCLKQL